MSSVDFRSVERLRRFFKKKWGRKSSPMIRRKTFGWLMNVWPDIHEGSCLIHRMLDEERRLSIVYRHLTSATVILKDSRWSFDLELSLLAVTNIARSRLSDHPEIQPVVPSFAPHFRIPGCLKRGSKVPP